jgi:hypothetical protein
MFVPMAKKGHFQGFKLRQAALLISTENRQTGQWGCPVCALPEQLLS